MAHYSSKLMDSLGHTSHILLQLFWLMFMSDYGLRLSFLHLRPDLMGPVLDPKSGLHMVSLPSPGFILDQKQAELTQRILDNLGNGLDVGVLGHVVYGLRRGEVKAFWSISRFDQSRTPQEVSKLEPQPLYLFKDFIQGG